MEMDAKSKVEGILYGFDAESVINHIIKKTNVPNHKS